MENYSNLSKDQRTQTESILTQLGVDSCYHDKIMGICDIYISEKKWQMSFLTKERAAYEADLKQKNEGKEDNPLSPASAQDARDEIERLKKLCDDFEETVTKGLPNFFLIHYMDAPPSLDDAIQAIQKLNSELQTTIKDLSGQAGRPSELAQFNLITHLANAYEVCFGKKPGYPNPIGSKGTPDGPFFRFTYNLISFLDGREINPYTLNSSIRKVLDNINRVRLSDGRLGARHGKKTYPLATECYHVHNETPDKI